MASITSLSNSNYNTSSIYGNRNVISGLASGMDTESMIENAVSGYKLKIQNLQKKRTKIEWQQEAYRSIIDKAVDFNRKYTSYSSKTNLLSASFFNNTVNTTTSGTYADKITASGRTSSDIKINAVKQMAQAATYTVTGTATSLGSKLVSAEAGKAPGISGEQFDLSKQLDVSNVSGSLTFKYGGTNGTSFDIKFDELEDWSQYEGDSNAEKLANAINKKLSEVSYSYTKNGFQETTTADKAVKVKVDSNGKISFSDGLGNGNKVSISYASGDIKDTLGISKDDTSIDGSKVNASGLSKPVNTYEYLAGEQKDGKWTGGKELSVTLNGATKKISMSDVMNNVDLTYDNASGKSKEKQFAEALQSELDKAFGKGKVTVSQNAETGGLSFTPAKEGDTFSVSGSATKALGFGDGDANYINTGKKLSDLMGDKAANLFSNDNLLRAVGTVKASGSSFVDSAGNTVRQLKDDDGNAVKDKDGNDIYYRVNKDGEALYDFSINDAHIAVTKDTTLDRLMNSINSNGDAGVKVSYSKLTNEFKFTATEMGANSKIEFAGMAKEMFDPEPDPNVEINHNFAANYGFTLSNGEKDRISVKFDSGTLEFEVDNKMTMQDFAKKIKEVSGGTMSASYDEKTGQFSVIDKSSGKEQQFTITDQYDFDYKREIEPAVNGKYTAGQDAVMDVEINGKRFENFTRGSNSFDIDGLTVNVKGTFEAVGKDGEDYEAVTFNTSTDADKIVDVIRSFVEDYNAMATEIKNAYSTMPQTKSNGDRYEPLTAEEEDKYSESELKAYNERAKQGILFGDSNLSSMYSKLLSAISPSGADGSTLRSIGIDTAYSNGMTTLSLDEDKLRAALESNPDKVKDAFTKTKEGGSSSNGLMQNLQNTLNTYVKDTGEPKGILIKHAGSIKAPTSLNSNTLKSQMNDLDSQIDSWTDRMSDQIDRYTSKFSKLEQLIAQMNSQSSTFSGLMGGSSGY